MPQFTRVYINAGSEREQIVSSVNSDFFLSIIKKQQNGFVCLYIFPIEHKTQKQWRHWIENRNAYRWWWWHFSRAFIGELYRFVNI